jgi:soluble lytic murein transglycosylase-like protein
MDPETNLTYAVRYLAGAYRAAGGNANRAVSLYASGYYRRGAPRAARVAAAPWQAPERW